MPIIQYREQRFNEETRKQIGRIIEIVDEYQAQSLRLTARQLYYQFVSRDYIPNTPRSYQNLTRVLANARYAGLVDWEAIEDRGRVPSTPSEWNNIQDLVSSACASFRLPRWEGQENYVELWVEKQALAGVLDPIARRYHATLMVNKGYSSASAMWESAQRFKEMGEDAERNPVLLYLGDHDPSGEDMVRDIDDRLREFEVPVTVRKIALTMEQIKRYKPPPNPAKITDSRYAAYAREHGTKSWEVDALPPDVLRELIVTAFEGLVDMREVNRIKAREERLLDGLRAAAKKIDKTTEE